MGRVTLELVACTSGTALLELQALVAQALTHHVQAELRVVSHQELDALTERGVRYELPGVDQALSAGVAAGLADLR